MERRIDEFSQKTIEVLGVLASILGISILVSFGLTIPNGVKDGEIAKKQAEVLAYSLWQVEVNSGWRPDSGQDQGRTIASPSSKAGSLSKDPWGHPFHYSFGGEGPLLLVWSTGPDGVDNSEASYPKMSGDDIGFLLDLKVKQ